MNLQAVASAAAIPGRCDGCGRDCDEVQPATVRRPARPSVPEIIAMADSTKMTARRAQLRSSFSWVVQASLPLPAPLDGPPGRVAMVKPTPKVARWWIVSSAILAGTLLLGATALALVEARRPAVHAPALPPLGAKALGRPASLATPPPVQIYGKPPATPPTPPAPLLAPRTP